MKTYITRLDCSETRSYQELLYKIPYSLLYHSLKYHSAISNHISAECHYVLSYIDGTLAGVLPFMQKNHERFGSILNSLPYYGSNGSFIINPELYNHHDMIRAQLINKFCEYSNTIGAKATAIVSNPFCDEDREWLDRHYSFDYSDQRIGQISILPQNTGKDTSSVLLGMFYDPRPRNIKRAEKADIIVKEHHDLDSLYFLFEVHRENIESIGGKPKERSFFENIPTYFSKKDYSVYVAYKNSRPISALLLFYFNETVEYFTPATIHEFRKDQPSSLIIHRAMIDAVHRGFRNWNWGGTWLNQGGVYDFKMRWGAKDFPYKYYVRVHEEWKNNNDLEEIKNAFPYFYIWPNQQ